MARTKRKNNGILITALITALVCILILGVCVSAVVTKGFTDGDPYGIVAKAKALDDLLDEKTSQEEEKTDTPAEDNTSETPTTQRMIKVGDNLSTLYFKQDVTPDFSMIDWNSNVMSENGLAIKALIVGDNGTAILSVGKVEFDLNDGNGVQVSYAIEFGNVIDHLGNSNYVVWDSAHGYQFESKNLTSLGDIETIVGAVYDIDFIESIISLEPIEA